MTIHIYPQYLPENKIRTCHILSFLWKFNVKRYSFKMSSSLFFVSNGCVQWSQSLHHQVSLKYINVSTIIFGVFDFKPFPWVLDSWFLNVLTGDGLCGGQFVLLNVYWVIEFSPIVAVLDLIQSTFFGIIWYWQFHNSPATYIFSFDFENNYMANSVFDGLLENGWNIYLLRAHRYSNAYNNFQSFPNT